MSWHLAGLNKYQHHNRSRGRSHLSAFLFHAFPIPIPTAGTILRRENRRQTTYFQTSLFFSDFLQLANHTPLCEHSLYRDLSSTTPTPLFSSAPLSHTPCL